MFQSLITMGSYEPRDLFSLSPKRSVAFPLKGPFTLRNAPIRAYQHKHAFTVKRERPLNFVDRSYCKLIYTVAYLGGLARISLI